MKKIAIITTHPIQYYAPLFAALSKNERFEIKVFYTWGEESKKPKFDPDFGLFVQWDIPLLQGYHFQFVKNVSKNPGSHRFFGIDNPLLIQDVESWGANVVWIWGWNFKSHLKAIRYFHRKIPVWFRGDSTLIDINNYSFWRRVFRKIFLTWIYHNVDLAFYVGSKNKDYFLEYGLKAEQLIFAPHAIENERFTNWTNSNEQDLITFRKTIGISESDFVVLFVGKLEPKKNPTFILDLASKLTSMSFKFLFVGDGILKDKLRQNSLGDERILFLPFQNQSIMPLIYRLGSVLIMPSVGPGETWGLAINEAMASGIPVFASNMCGGATDLIDFSVGRVFQTENIDYVLSELIKLHSNNSKTQLNKESIINKVSSFSYENIYQSILIGLNKTFSNK